MNDRALVEQDAIVTCNECEHEFILPKLKRTVLKDLVYKFYFHCPDCNHEYVSYYTNQKIRRDINRQKKRWQKYQKIQTEEAGRKLLAQINMEDRLLKKDMDALMVKMQKELV